MSNQNLQTEGQGAQAESGSASEASAGAARLKPHPVTLRPVRDTLQGSREFYAMKGDLESVEEIGGTLREIDRALSLAYTGTPNYEERD